jgi:predicted DNA-binding protein
MPVLKIKAKQFGPQSAVYSMRLPVDMVKQLEEIARATGRTRNELFSICIEFAIDHMQIETSNPQK